MVQRVKNESWSATTLEAAFVIVTELWTVAGSFTLVYVYNDRIHSLHRSYICITSTNAHQCPTTATTIISVLFNLPVLQSLKVDLLKYTELLKHIFYRDVLSTSYRLSKKASNCQTIYCSHTSTKVHFKAVSTQSSWQSLRFPRAGKREMSIGYLGRSCSQL